MRKWLHFVCNLPVKQDETDVPQIDVSDDKMASFRRWFHAVDIILQVGFFIWGGVIFFVLPPVATTIIATILVLSAGLLLLICISRGARWARISTYVLGAWTCVLLILGIICLFWIVPGICFLLASVLLLLPNVSRGLKTLSHRTRFAWVLCVLFWVMVVISHILVLSTPEVEDVQPAVNHYDYTFVFLIYFVGFVGLYIFSMIIVFFLNWIMGGVVCPAKVFSSSKSLLGDMESYLVVYPVKVVSSKKRDVACPKCARLMSVPDADENGLEVCPSCGYKFYPFGLSGFAITAFVLGLFSILVIPAPFALLFGILALKDIKKNRGRHGITRAWFGVVMALVSIVMILVFVLIALIAS